MPATNAITGDTIANTKGNAKAYAKGYDLIVWDDVQEEEEVFMCKYCGMPSRYPPEDQYPPPDYCHESDHGF